MFRFLLKKIPLGGRILKTFFAGILISIVCSSCATTVKQDATRFVIPDITTQKENSLYKQGYTIKEMSECWEKLGEKYYKFYISKLVFDALIGLEKVKEGHFLYKRFLQEGLLSSCERVVRAQPLYKEEENGIVFSQTDYLCKIAYPERFMRSIAKNEKLTFFLSKKKIGSFWVFIDLSVLSTPEALFWYAYFTEQGLQPEIDFDLKLLIAAHFDNVKDALLFKQKFSSLPLKVKYVVYYPALSFRPSKKIKLKEETEGLTEEDIVPLKPREKQNKGQLFNKNLIKGDKKRAQRKIKKEKPISNEPRLSIQKKQKVLVISPEDLLQVKKRKREQNQISKTEEKENQKTQEEELFLIPK